VGGDAMSSGTCLVWRAGRGTDTNRPCRTVNLLVANRGQRKQPACVPPVPVQNYGAVLKPLHTLTPAPTQFRSLSAKLTELALTAATAIQAENFGGRLVSIQQVQPSKQISRVGAWLCWYVQT
jgi:hypothetical protein